MIIECGPLNAVLLHGLIQDESEGKSAYFPAETAFETDFKKDKNYLVTPASNAPQLKMQNRVC